MKKILFAIFILFLYSRSYGQIKNYVVKGKLIGEDSLSLIGASVVLLNTTDSVLIAYATSDVDGNFEIKRVKAGEYKFQITYIGLGTIEKTIKVEGSNAIMDLGKITMYNSSTLLGEVSIKSEYTPIIVKKDTVEYNADAYLVRPNANVEELLKKLPGIEVAQDGTITAQGEQVQKVMVDGKKFFTNDPRLATQNLPADAVKKVQVIDKKSDKAIFSGVSDGETEKVINLELKPDKKVGTFGEVKAGVGDKDRFDTKINLNKFTGNYQLALIGNFNNLSNQGLSYGEYGQLAGNNNSFGNNNGLLNNGASSGQVKSLTSAVNLYKEVTSKFNFATSYFYTYSSQYLFENTNRENITGAQNFYSYKNTDSNTDKNQHNVILNIQAKPDSSSRVDFEGTLRFNDSNSKNISSNGTKDLSLRTISATEQIDSTTNNSHDASMKLTITKRIKKPGRILSFIGSYGVSNTESDYEIDRNELLTVTQLLQNQLSNLDNNNYSLYLEYKEPIGNQNYLGLGYTRKNNTNRTIKDFYDIDPINGNIEIKNEILSSFSNNDILYDKASLLYTKDHDNYNINSSATWHHSQLQGIANLTNNRLAKSYNYFLPSLNINWTAKKIGLRYSTSVNEPTTTQLQPIVNNSDPYNIYQGNLNLRPEYNHELRLRYHLFDNFNFRSLFAFINFKLTNDKIINKQSIDEFFVKTTSPVNTKNNKAVNVNVSFSSPIKPLKIKARIYGGGSITKSYNFINEIENDVITQRPRIGLELENTKNKVVSLIVGSEYNYSDNKYSKSTFNNSSYSTQSLWSNLSIQPGKGFSIESDFNHNIYYKTTLQSASTLTFINAGVSKRIFNDRLTISLKGFDLLNVGSGITRNITETYVEQVTNNAIGRYFLLRASYRLSQFNLQSNRGGEPPRDVMRGERRGN